MTTQAVPPLYLIVALHYHTRPPGVNYPDDRLGADKTDAIHQRLVDEQLLHRSEGGVYTATRGLDAYVRNLCAQPRPQTAWLFPAELDALRKSRG